MKIYGLTGGIAAGKSEASKRFVELGVPVLDADRIAHATLEPGGVAESPVLEAFGETILTCGIIDRDKLGAVVFDDPQALARLNGLVHPAVRAEIATRCAQLASEGHGAAILDAALLAEEGSVETTMAGLIIVACPVGERKRRLIEIRGLDPQDADRRIAAQTPPEEKIRLATWVIENTGTLEELRKEVEEIARQL